MSLVDERECICPWHPYGEHITLRCKNHPEARFSTKNIAPIGARNIFNEKNACACPLSLYHTCPESEAFAAICGIEKKDL